MEASVCGGIKMAAHMLLSERSKNEVGCEVSRVLEELCLSRGEALGCNIEATQVGELPLFLQGCLCRVHDYCNALGTSRSWVAGGDPGASNDGAALVRQPRSSTRHLLPGALTRRVARRDKKGWLGSAGNGWQHKLNLRTWRSISSETAHLRK